MKLSFRARPYLGGLLLTLVAGCGGDNPAGPDDNDTPPKALSIASPSVQTLQIISVGVRGVTLASQTVDGRFAGQAIKGARLDDTTLAVIVPPVAAGAHELRFDIAGQPFTANLQVTATAPATDADAYFDGVFVRLTAEADTIDQVLAAATASTAASDTAGLRAIAQQLRWAADSGRKIVTGMSAADRAMAAAYLRTNSDTTPVVSPSPLAGGPSFAIGGCDGGTTAECNAELRLAWEQLQAKIASCTLSAVKWGAAGAIVGGVLGSGAFSLPFAALGAVLGSAAGTAICVYDINDSAMETIITPAITNLDQAIPGASYEVAPAAVYYRVKSPKDVVVTAEVRSLIASDASLPGVEGIIARTVNTCTTLWTKLMQVSKVSLPGPKLPETPQNRIVREMPASLLKIGTISLAGATATTAGDDTSFRVTFVNDKQGADHSFSYAVRYEPAGRPAQERVLSGVLRPERYAVASLAVDSAPAEMRVGQGTVKLHWIARDSSGAFLGGTGVDSLLNGRKPEWTSDKPGVATVSADGVLTAVDTGTVAITARLEGGTATVAFTVYPNVTGSWSLKILNGNTVPYAEPDSTGTTDYLGGAISIAADSTFTFGYAETYTNKFTGIVYDEGSSGSGTYTLRGNSIVFTILQKSGESVEQIVGASFADGALTVTYSGPDGSAVGQLRR